jgi:hypothetical protein
MEANLVVKVDELNADFIDGIRKVFSRNAVLNIRVEYDTEAAPEGGKTRGRKAKSASASDGSREKRAYKKRSAVSESAEPVERKKPGPKPKNKVAD